ASPIADATAALGGLAGGGPAPAGPGGQGGPGRPGPIDITKEQVSPPLGLSLDLAGNRAAIVVPGNGDFPVARYFGWTLYRFAPPANVPANLIAQATAQKPPTPAPAPANASATGDDSGADEVDLPRVWLK